MFDRVNRVNGYAPGRRPDRDVRPVAVSRRGPVELGASVAFALGIAYGSRATMLIAAVIFAEELYETGVVLLILRHHRS